MNEEREIKLMYRQALRLAKRWYPKWSLKRRQAWAQHQVDEVIS